MDDDPQVLAALANVLRRHFDIVTAGSGAAGAEALTNLGPFTVVVSDFGMPGMNGTQFLAQARVLAPNTIRVLLTGNGNLDGAIAAVDDGDIFRFLVKPCAPDQMLRALRDAIEQARLADAADPG